MKIKVSRAGNGLLAIKCVCFLKWLLAFGAISTATRDINPTTGLCFTYALYGTVVFYFLLKAVFLEKLEEFDRWIHAIGYGIGYQVGNTVLEYGLFGGLFKENTFLSAIEAAVYTGVFIGTFVYGLRWLSRKIFYAVRSDTKEVSDNPSSEIIAIENEGK